MMKHETHPTFPTYNMAKYYCEYKTRNIAQTLSAPQEMLHNPWFIQILVSNWHTSIRNLCYSLLT